MPKQLIMAERAFRMVEEDCLQHPSTETGGVLVGSLFGEEVVVPFVVAAGRRAHRSMGGFRPDSAWQQRYLDYLFTRFGAGIDYIGDYHRHPGSFDRPSAIDARTAQRIVTSRRWNKPLAAFPIIVLENGRVRMRGYVMSRERKEFQEVPIVIVPDTDARMRAVILNEEVRKEVHRGQSHAPSRRAGSARASRFLRFLGARVRRRPAG